MKRTYPAVCVTNHLENAVSVRVELDEFAFAAPANMHNKERRTPVEFGEYLRGHKNDLVSSILRGTIKIAKVHGTHARVQKRHRVNLQL